MYKSEKMTEREVVITVLLQFSSLYQRGYINYEYQISRDEILDVYIA